MNYKKYIAILLLAGIAIIGVILFKPVSEPSYHGHRLSWWVDEYGNNENHPERKAEGKAALSAIGTNAVPYLMGWIANVDAKPSSTRRSFSSLLNHLPKGIEPDSLVSWADETDFTTRMWDRAWRSATAFSALGTNATPYIPELRALAASPTKGNACVVAESALANMGPDGIAAAFDVIAMPGLHQRGLLMQSAGLGEHLGPPDAMTLPGHEDLNFRINSIRAAPVLLKCLEDNDPTVRRWAVRWLSGADPTSMVPALTNFLVGSPPPALRRLATDALAVQGKLDRDVAPFFTSRLHDLDPAIRDEATNALAKIAAGADKN